MNIPGYDDWKLMPPEEEREQHGDYDWDRRTDAAESELDLVYQDLHDAQTLISEMYAALHKALDFIDADDEPTHADARALTAAIRAAVAKAEESK